MKRKYWKDHQTLTSMSRSIELCLEHARFKYNRSIDQVADRMGLANKWTLYKWMESGRLPAILIRPFEVACGVDYVSRYIGHSAHKLLVDIPTGRKATSRDINTLQTSFSDAVSLLLKFYDNQQEVEETLSALYLVMEQLALHQGEVTKFKQPELDLEGSLSNEV